MRSLRASFGAAITTPEACLTTFVSGCATQSMTREHLRDADAHAFATKRRKRGAGDGASLLRCRRT